MSSPSVTVLTAVRNGARYVTDTIDSIRSQTFDDWEFLIVDDASDDNTLEVVVGHQRTDRRIIVMRRDAPGGPYAAANTGLANARGRYIARIDADDVAPPDRLERQVAFMDARPGVEALTGAWRAMDSGGALGAVTKPHAHGATVLRWTLCVLPGIVHSTACIQRRALIEVGGYPELEASADLWLWCTFARRGTLAATDDVYVNYRVHDAQITTARAEIQRRIGAELLRDHIESLTGERWSIDDVAALHASGRWIVTDLERGARAIDRWAADWRADTRLTAADRRALARITMRVRLRHLRVSGRGFSQGVRGAANVVAHAGRAIFSHG